MAERDSGIISTIAQVVEKFVGDYSIWLWLMIFGATILLLDKYNTVSLSDLSNDRRSMAIASFGFACCMFLNAIRLQERAFQVGKQIFKFAVSTIEERRLKSRNLAHDLAQYNKHQQSFKEIVYVDCKERTWLLWYIFIYKPRKKSFYAVHNMLHDSSSGFILWADPIAERLTRVYGILKVYEQQDRRSLTSSDTLLYESFALEEYLRELTSLDPELKAQLKIERDSILSSLPENAEFKTYGDNLRDPRMFVNSEKPWFSESRNPTVEQDLLS